MCGIIGVIKYNIEKYNKIIKNFENGLKLMRGRGPDGYWIYVDYEVILGQSLLLITDPTTGGQPYASNDFSIVACANGEIYNSSELRTSLEKLGARFLSNSDCEVIAHGYYYWGEDLFERLAGMFAIGIYDRNKNALIITRDRVGIRPLYFTQQSKYLAFASEPRFLTLSGLASSEVCEEGLFHTLILRHPIEPITIYKDVRAVLPGQILTFDTKKRKTERFFASIPSRSSIIETEKPEKKSPVDPIRSVVTKSVERRIPHICKYSTFLSGGLDSTIVTKLSTINSNLRLPSMVCGFSTKKGINERKNAQIAANLLDRKLVSRTLSLEHFITVWPFLVWANSGPIMFNSSIPLFSLCREAYSRGAKVILSGEGADELFVGYLRYQIYNYIKIDDGTPEFLLRFDDEVNDPIRVLSRWILDGDWGIKQWKSLKDRITAIAPFKGRKNGLIRKLDFDNKTFLIALLMRQDRVGLTSSIEIRVPFLDTEVIEKVMEYPTILHIKDGTGKLLLRKAFQDQITHRLAWIPKIGFPVPFGRWLSNSGFRLLCSNLNENLNHTGVFKKDIIKSIEPIARGGEIESLKELWTLLNIAIWWGTRDSFTSFFKIFASILPNKCYYYWNKLINHTQNASVLYATNNLIDNQKFPFLIISNGWTNSQVIPHSAPNLISIQK